jgi:hypothetical protein
LTGCDAALGTCIDGQTKDGAVTRTPVAGVSFWASKYARMASFSVPNAVRASAIVFAFSTHVILSVTALYSLKQDRASIDQDARRNAAVLAAEVTPLMRAAPA